MRGRSTRCLRGSTPTDREARARAIVGKFRAWIRPAGSRGPRARAVGRRRLLHAVDERDPGPQEREQVRAVEPAPTRLRHVEELVGYQEPLRPRPRALRHALAEPRRPRTGIRSSSTSAGASSLCGKVEEREQGLGILLQRRNGLRVLGPVLGGELGDRLARPLPGLGLSRRHIVGCITSAPPSRYAQASDGVT